jgi:hypothetical protein
MTMDSPARGHDVRTDELVFLTGRPPMEEAIAFVKESSTSGDIDLARLAADWKAANARIQELEKTESGIADDPPMAALPALMEPLRQKLLGDPIFKSSYSMIPNRIAMVGLDRLVVYQRYIRMDLVRAIQAGLGPRPSTEDIFTTCLPYNHPRPDFHADMTARGSFDFTSESSDLRFLDVRLLGPEQLTGYSPPGPVAAVVGLVVGFGSNFLNAVHVENRLILNNGSHRAYALREMGIERVPCIVQDARGREELGTLISQEVCRNADRYLNGPRPPILKDYFDPALRRSLKAVHKLRQVRVSFEVRQTEVPAR